MQDIAEWSLLWGLRDLPTPDVVCKACGATQVFEARFIGFEHKFDCDVYAPIEQLPWRDLLWILEHLSRGAE
ncbi:hypothetical protein AO269_19730 [Pseudomonas putida]|nr:hypothetical protein AO269_19730 [Pseudomonas putida]